eukprot:TRINITY_DN1419_c0_g4_i1.p1 TRINITY_DN1419_c0_g4~~TRINITY_DN1419_c0_g4_i1.p1  ORF type:complete len:562 (+),score=173.47 TRINITY_DN1419_c0_g4_i1:66-1688(+)
MASKVLAAAALAQTASAFVAPVPGQQSSQALRGATVDVITAPGAPSAQTSNNTGAWTAAAGVVATAAVAGAVSQRRQRRTASTFTGKAVPVRDAVTSAFERVTRDAKVVVYAGKRLPEGRKLRVAVVGGGPAGACAADTLAAAGIETYMIERKLDNCKPCGGAIPVCMIDEFDLPPEIVDRRVRKMTMISPTNKEVQIGQTLKDDEYIGMVRREVLDNYLRERAAKNGAHVINGLFMGMEMPADDDLEGSYTLTYNDFGGQDGTVSRKGEKKTLEVDVVIGADGANSRVARDIKAGDFEYAIAFQERMKIPEERMEWYKERAEMYVGADVSPDFYAWVFPKCDHVAVGTGSVCDKKGVQKYQQGIRERAANRIAGGEIIRAEAHPIPEHYRPRRVNNRAALVGDAAGYVTKCSGEGIYFAAKSGRMVAEMIAYRSENGARMVTQSDLEDHLAQWDANYGPTYFVLDLLQKLFFSSDAANESFVELCDLEYVQKVTFDSYLYKKVQGNSPIDDVALLSKTLSSLAKNNLGKKQEKRELVAM